MPPHPRIVTASRLRTATLLLLLIGSISGCTGARTQLASVDRREVEAEEQFQSALYWHTLAQQQQRLSTITYELRRAGTPLCGSLVAYDPGFRIALIEAASGRLKADQKQAARQQDARLIVVGVLPGSAAEQAGLRDGDRVYALGQRTLRKNDRLSQRLGAWNRDLERSADGVATLGIERAGVRVPIAVRAERMCHSPAYVIADGGLNAFADGRSIGVTMALMRYLNDDELSAIVGHELAHNIMDHLGTRAGNETAGSILGAIGDVALAMVGVNTGGHYTREGGRAGAKAFSQDFEREADYVGLYLLARAGRPLDRAIDVWRQMAIANPGSITYAGSHPTSAERFVRLRQAVAEIEAKQQAGAALVPNMRQRTRGRSRPSAPSLPPVALAPQISTGAAPQPPARESLPKQALPPSEAASAAPAQREAPQTVPQARPPAPPPQPLPLPSTPAAPVEGRRRAPGRPPSGN